MAKHDGMAMRAVYLRGQMDALEWLLNGGALASAEMRATVAGRLMALGRDYEAALDALPTDRIAAMPGVAR